MVHGNFYVDIINRQLDRLFRQASDFVRNVLHINIMYLKASADVNISTFLEKNGGMRLWITKWTIKLADMVTLILTLREVSNLPEVTSHLISKLDRV